MGVPFWFFCGQAENKGERSMSDISKWKLSKSGNVFQCVSWVLLLAILLMTGIADVMAEETSPAENAVTQLTPAHEKAVYTIEGKKDPRLQATFLATYISTSKSPECSQRNSTTGTRKVNIGSKRYPITEEKYRIEIPVYLEENENECGYRFSRIELILRRQYDDELYSRHILLSSQPKAHAIYFGTKTGFGGQASLTMPAMITTDKRYFRIAKETQYICRTKWYAYDGHTTFHCFMQIRDGQGESQFVPTNEQQTVVAHPEFGIDEIKTDTLHVDILADDAGSKANLNRDNVNAQDSFRTLPIPKAPQGQTSGKSLLKWLKDLF
jgi:hypothetical protein